MRDLTNFLGLVLNRQNTLRSPTVVTPNSCIRCSKPAVLLSPSGLCPDCATAADTADPTPPVSQASNRILVLPTTTGSPENATLTAGFASTHALPHAPPGYDLLDRLGAGGMGSVYLAREQTAERLVAMKFLHSPSDPASYDRFLVELRILAQLDHPNIVRVLASDFLRADPFFTMEHMAGGSLLRWLDKCKPMPVEEAVRIIRAVASAVHAAHAGGVIHRDLKPSNILLTTDGTPKVSDFGLAKRLEHNDQLTQASGALGTASYMPPEQVSRKNGEIGQWSDVYGLGATLYHLLTGQTPFLGETTEETILQVLSDSPTRPRALRADIPLALEAIMLKCLEKDPKDRYQTMAELIADLDRYLAGQKTIAPPLTRWRRVKRWAGQNRQGLVASVVAALLLVSAFALGAAYWPRPKQVEPPDPRDEIWKQLQDGHKVVLQGGNGLPRWQQWRTSPVVLAESALPDEGCSFQTTTLSLLDLLSDPKRDRYRITAELRHMDGRAPAPEAQISPSKVGFYFSAASGATRAIESFTLARIGDQWLVGIVPRAVV